MATNWFRVFVLTAVLGGAVVSYATFRLLAVGLDYAAGPARPWATGGLVVAIAAWVLGVARELLAGGSDRSVAQALRDAGLWTDGKKS